MNITCKSIYKMQERKNLIPFQKQTQVIEMLSQYIVLGPCQEIIQYVGVFPEIKYGQHFDCQAFHGTWVESFVLGILSHDLCMINYVNEWGGTQQGIVETSVLETAGLYSKL